MNIGILTFQFADNYGAVLQAYSLKKMFEECACEAELDCKVEIINYKSSHFKNAYSINPLVQSGLKNKTKAFLKYPIKKIQHQKFDDFRADYIQCNKNTITKIPSHYDIVVIGSDQIWNLDITGNDFTYFAEGIHAKGIYSYAASSKDAFITVDVKSRIQQCLSEFDAISVREASMLQDINDIGISGEVVLDPVLLHDRKFWEEIEKPCSNMPEHYILYYGLAGNKKLENAAKELSEKTGLEIIVIHPMAQKITSVGKVRHDVGPQEFIYLIHHADYIFSNSFHAFAFSCIYSKMIYFEFIPGLSNRVGNLTNLLGLHDRMKSEFHVNKVQVDLDKNSRYKEHKENSVNFIRKILFKG